MSRSGLRLDASSSARARRAAATSARQSIFETNLEEVMSSSAASPLCPLFTYAVETAMRCGKVSARCSPPARLGGELFQGLGDPRRTEQVDLDGAVQGSVEGDGGGRVDHDVARAQQGPSRLVEGEPVASDVAGDRVEAPGDHVIEARTELGPEAIEAVVAQDLAPGALDGSLALARADEYDDLAFGHASAASARRAPFRGNPWPRSRRSADRRARRVSRVCF